MTELVVNLLESVEVEREQRDWNLVALASIEHALCTIHKGASIDFGARNSGRGGIF